MGELAFYKIDDPLDDFSGNATQAAAPSVTLGQSLGQLCVHLAPRLAPAKQLPPWTAGQSDHCAFTCRSGSGDRPRARGEVGVRLVSLLACTVRLPWRVVRWA